MPCVLQVNTVDVVILIIVGVILIIVINITDYTLGNAVTPYVC